MKQNPSSSLRRRLLTSPLPLPLWLGVTLLSAAPGIRGGAPEVDSLFPAGGQLGTRFAVTAAGRLDPWPAAVWADDLGIRFTAGATNGQFQVDLAPTASAGPHLLRLYTAQGASAPVLFVVGTVPEVVSEPASPTGQPNPEPPPAPIPATLNGQLRSTDGPAVFRIEAPDECVLRARFIAGALDSPAQGALTLLKDGSEVLVKTQDPTGRDFDLRCPLPVGGALQLQASPLPESRLGEAAVFRIEVTADPLVRLPPPLTTSADSENVTAFRPMTAARTLAVPGETRGVISPQGREIFYSFTARQNEQFRFVARAGSIGSPLMPLLRILDRDRNVLATSVPAEDGELVWVAHDDAEHLLAVADARGEGGPTYACQIEVDKPQTRFSAALETDAFRLAPGEAAHCRVRILRPAQSDLVVHVSAAGLPEGVVCLPQVAAPGVDEVDLRMVAEPGAKPANGPFRVMVMTTGEAPPRIEYARFRLRSRQGAGARLLIADSDQPWLTVSP